MGPKRKMEWLIIGLIGGAAYLYFAGAPAATTPLPTLTSTPIAASSPTPTLSTGLATSTTPTIPAYPVSASLPGVASPGTTMSSQPLAAGSTPPDSYFIAQAQAIYTQGTGLSGTNKYFVNFTNMLTAALASLTLSPTGDNCSGFSSSNVSFSSLAQLGGTAASAGLTVGGLIGGPGSVAAGVASTAIPIIGIGVAVVTLIAGIFAHHAAKVKAQAQYDCAMTAACNNAWSEITNAIQQGQLTAAQAYQAFEAVYTQATSLLTSSPAPPNGPKPGDCNNPCNLLIICRAVTNKFEAMYGLAA